MEQVCSQCKQHIEEWNRECASCGLHFVLEPEEARRVRYLRAPSLGALFFTQGWTLGARLYVWFLISLMPVAGFVALFACLFFGRRWSWKYGGWSDWEFFTKRMRLLDVMAIVWIVILGASYFWLRYHNYD